MFRNNQTTAWLATCALLCGVLVHSSVAAAPPGKGGGGGGTSPPSLPADLDVRYRVQFIPLPPDASNSVVHDVNDVHEAVGAYNDIDGFRVGYYYDADADTDADPDTPALLTANQMIPSLPAEWVSTSFTGINNYGEIVGMVQDTSGFRQCILISPSLLGGYSYEITSPSDAFGPMDSHFNKINDYGDIVGISWDDADVSFAFAYNPGLHAIEDFRDFTFYTMLGYWNSVIVTNARLGTAQLNEEWYSFNFLTGLTSQIPQPLNLYNPGSVVSMSNDGQIAVTVAQVSQKGKNVSYRKTPGIMVNDQYVWQGNLDDGAALLVNSAVGPNGGDVVGFNDISRVGWLRHADHPEWGYLDLNAMVVFNSSTDAQRWSSLPESRVHRMSDRDPATGFGVLTGHNSGLGAAAAYVLVPEVVP